MPALAPTLDRIGMTATDAVHRTEEAVQEALDSQVLTKPELSAQVTERLPDGLRVWCEPCSARHVNELLLRTVALSGLLCFAPRTGKHASFVRTDQWLGAPPAEQRPSQARAELARRYLHCYGPSTAEDFAAWAGVAPAHAKQCWRLVGPELLPVELEGKPKWLHAWC